MTTWVVSDTHFLHNKLIELGERLINNDELIINEWNSKIKFDDKVIHCGDFALGEEFDKIEEIVNELNGNITLLLGNHDTPIKVSKIYSRYFRCMGVLHDGEFVYSYYPVHTTTLEEVCPRTNGHNERYNIHGHLHNRCVRDKRYFNANWDMTNSYHLGDYSSHIYNLNEVKSFVISRSI